MYVFIRPHGNIKQILHSYLILKMVGMKKKKSILVLMNDLYLFYDPKMFSFVPPSSPVISTYRNV